MIQIEQLVVRYGSVTAVDGLSLRIDQGARFGLLGPNGAGKTSTISCIAGLLAPSAGHIRVHDIDVASRPDDVRRAIGLVPQSLALYPSLSLLENLKIFGGLMGLGGRKLRERVGFALELAQLESKRDARVEQLSGGMKRRLNLAASLLHEPRIVICDEPTTGVDPQSRNHIFETIRRLQQQGTTVVYTTHYMEEVEALCDEVAIIDHGQIIAHDKLATLLAPPAAPTGFVMRLEQPTDVASVGRALAAAGHTVECLQTTPRTLEEVFLELTGRQLREAE
jgi:ABC-2 type transport system ATP-binding protein